MLLYGQSICRAWDARRGMPGMGWCQAAVPAVPGAQGSHGAGHWHSPAVLMTALQSRGCQLLSPVLLPAQQTSSLPCTAEALPESCIPHEILDYTSLAGEKDGFSFKRLAFTHAPVWFVFSL